MRLIATTLIAALLTAGLGSAGAAPIQPPPKAALPGGQIDVVTVNAHQRAVLGIKRFRAMFELSRALRIRPAAFDGGYRGGVAPPDVVIAEEMRPSNLEIFQHLLRQRWQHKYMIAGPDNSSADILFDPDRVQLDGDVKTWVDPCISNRTYELAHMSELTTGLPFVIAGVHFWRSYSDPSCISQNVDMLRSQLASETDPTIIGGDFNRRSVQTPFECDRDETSPPLDWWSQMTSPTDGGRAYVDAVRTWADAHRTGMASQWTQEQFTLKELCDSTSGYRRSRIDYLFVAGAAIGEATADNPGWSGKVAGTVSTTNYKYSDHRFVWGRFVLGGPLRPDKPSAQPERGGRIQLTWTPVSGADHYVVYRAIRGHPYDALASVPSSTTSYLDYATEDATPYTYSIAAVGVDGAQGLESPHVSATADASGPDVIQRTPPPGATGVDPGITIVAVTDQAIDPSSVGSASIRLFRGDHRVDGTVLHPSARELKFNPSSRLREGVTYKVIVSGLRDALGNKGHRAAWTFTTVLPPPKHHKKHHRR